MDHGTTLHEMYIQLHYDYYVVSESESELDGPNSAGAAWPGATGPGATRPGGATATATAAYCP